MPLAFCLDSIFEPLMSSRSSDFVTRNERLLFIWDIFMSAIVLVFLLLQTVLCTLRAYYVSESLEVFAITDKETAFNFSFLIWQSSGWYLTIKKTRLISHTVATPRVFCLKLLLPPYCYHPHTVTCPILLLPLHCYYPYTVTTPHCYYPTLLLLPHCY